MWFICSVRMTGCLSGNYVLFLQWMVLQLYPLLCSSQLTLTLCILFPAAHKLVRRAEEGQGSGREGVRLNGEEEESRSGCKCWAVWTRQDKVCLCARTRNLLVDRGILVYVLPLVNIPRTVAQEDLWLYQRTEPATKTELAVIFEYKTLSFESKNIALWKTFQRSLQLEKKIIALQLWELCQLPRQDEHFICDKLFVRWFWKKG